MLITVVADYGAGDLAFAEVRQRFAKLFPQAQLNELPVPPFDTVGAGFGVAQLARGDGPADRVVYVNVAPRRDEDDPREDNAGEPLAACRLANGVLVVGVAAGHTFSFLDAPVRAVRVTDAGSQFRSRDVFPDAVFKILRGDDLLGAELTVPPPPARSVIWIDGYGNLKTSWQSPPGPVGSTVTVRIGQSTRQAVVSDGVFAVPNGTMSFAPGSSGWDQPFYELLLRGGNAAEAFGSPPNGTPVDVT